MPDGPRRRPIVGVMGSGSDEHASLAEEVGRVLAEEGVHLLNGGGRGVMEAASRGFHRTRPRAGLVVGICPGEIRGDRYLSKPGYPNPWVEIPIRTHLPESGLEGESAGSRNHINVLSSDVVVALPGGPGTASEIRLALRYGRPVVSVGRAAGDPPGVRALAGPDEIRRILNERLGSRDDGAEDPR